MEQPVQQAVPAQSAQYRGVGGWLLLFILTVLLFTPAVHIYVFYKEWSLYHSQPSPLLFNFLLIDSSMRAVLVCFGIYAGIQLARIKPQAPAVAKKYLVGIVVQQLVLLLVGFWLVQKVKAGPGSLEDLLKEPLRALLYVVIWYSYFVKSARVAATYRPDEAIQPDKVLPVTL